MNIMIVKIAYIMHLLTIAVTYYCLQNRPNHYFIRKGVVYAVLAFVFFFLNKTSDIICVYFDIKMGIDLRFIIAPISTIYHLYFFLLVTSDSVLYSRTGRKIRKRLFVFILVFLVVIDLYNQTHVYAYFYTNFLIIFFSVVYFKEAIKDFVEKIEFKPEGWIAIGYLIFSITSIPFTILIDYTKGTNANLTNHGMNNIEFVKIFILIPTLMFYSSISYGCYRYLVESKRIHSPPS